MPKTKAREDYLIVEELNVQKKFSIGGTASIGNQSNAPAAGSVYIKTWQPTAANDVTPIAATTFGKKVNWIAIGT